MGTIYMHKLQTARLALTLLLTAGPLSAFADDDYFGRQPQGGLQGPTDLPELPSYTQSASSLTQTVSATSTAPAHISEAVAAATNTGVPNAAVTNNGARNTANGTQPSATTQPAQTQWQNYPSRAPNPQTVPTNYTNGAAYGAGMGYGPTSHFGSGPGAYGPPVVSAQELTSQGPGLFFRWDRVYFT
jgi:hypothetical protein